MEFDLDLKTEVWKGLASSVLRTWLSAAGGGLIASGLITPEQVGIVANTTVEVVSGAVLVGVVQIFSWIKAKKAAHDAVKVEVLKDTVAEVRAQQVVGI